MNQILASVFSKFKTKNPSLAAIILGVLIAGAAFLQAPSTIELLGDKATSILKWINIVLIALVGTPTTKFLDVKKK